MWFSFHQFLPVWNIHLNSLLISALSGDAKLPTNVLLGRGGSLLLWRTPDPSQGPLKSCDPHSRMVSTSIHNPEQLKQQANVQVLGFPVSCFSPDLPFLYPSLCMCHGRLGMCSSKESTGSYEHSLLGVSFGFSFQKFRNNVKQPCFWKATSTNSFEC